ncbi:hypothetical protein P4U03_30135 [Bacillus mycoides]|uniref:Uncharacterized protein n=8 Tax=root TaxID=1 RepID=I7J6Y6_9CAUD|nr:MULTISPECIES: hypothetical protein [Bacteria]YP_006560746.1 hypothetical protein B605_gp58 [Staphylococcus phage SpaA1]YP_009099271.1 hypothetical protein Waukesha92_06 [Bacillus phage Waukesha92]YP_009218193.1 hypothetical protein XO28_0060 [Bacillus phage phi4J1]YP_009829869.1 hypothetical protein HWA83_gp58 [Bacillus phage BceA1]ALO79951.1 hypothetical protein XO29_0072 [Bacillus phage phiS58]MED1158362.1 hypothetical protein [Bacillus paranthracis]QCW20849.1 hypothetical protein WG69_
MDNQYLAERIDRLEKLVNDLDSVNRDQQKVINDLCMRIEGVVNTIDHLKKELSTKMSVLPKDAQEKIEKLKKAAEGIVDG